jgi:hypothetical protein
LRPSGAKGVKKPVLGRGGYPPTLVRQVRDAWASGEYNSDKALAEAFNLSRSETIAEWRIKHAPDGISWDSIRDKLNQGALDVIAQRLGESSADATLRHLKIVRAAQTTVARYIFGQRLELADGTTMSIPSVEPKSLGEAVKSYIDLVRIERHMRGEPDVRVEHYLTLVGEVVAEVATLFVAEMGLPAARVVRFEELFGDKLKGALADAERKLLPAGTEAERWTADEGEEE